MRLKYRDRQKQCACEHKFYRPSESYSYIECSECRHHLWVEIPKHIHYKQGVRYLEAKVRKHNKGIDRIQER